DVDRRLHQLVARSDQPGPVVLLELSGAQTLRLDLRLAAEEALSYLRLRHLEREQRDRRRVPEREVCRDAQSERGLPHAGTRGDDDEVPGLEAGRQPVEVAEAGGHPRDVGAGLVESGDPLET